MPGNSTHIDWAGNRLSVASLNIGSFSSYTTGANGTTRVIPTMTASTADLTTATTVGVTAIGFQTTAAFSSHVVHVNKLTQDVAALFRLVTAIVDDLKTTV